MKGLVITSKGIEDAAALEIKELISAECKAEEGCVIFDFKDYKDLCLLCYKSQSADRVLYLIGNFGFENFFDDFEIDPNFVSRTKGVTIFASDNDQESVQKTCP